MKFGRQRLAVVLCAFVAALVAPQAALALTNTTTTSTPSATTIPLGGSVTDTATVVGLAPTGTVNFSVCGPPSSASGCASGGTLVGSQILSVSSPYTATSPSFTPDAAGTWCFRADYQGDLVNGPSSDGGMDECFTVTQLNSTTNTHAQNTTIVLTDSNADVATVTGNSTGGTPAGTVMFHECGPGASSCSSGGMPVGSPVQVAPGPGNTATATSAPFTPKAAGMYCFRADYSGGGNYSGSSDGTSDNCFTVPVPGAPTASITSPADGKFYGVGQVAPAGYACTDATTGPGIASCNGSVTDGAPIDTSTLGHHTFTVTATSQDGMSTTVIAGYTVAAAPSASIKSPKNGATYTLGELVAVIFKCREGQFGSGLAGCSAPEAVNTSSLGNHTFSVTAVSADGQQRTATVHFRVVVASNKFSVSRLAGHQNGAVTFKLKIPGGGRIQAVETAPRSALPQPKGAKPQHGSFVFARRNLRAAGKKTIRLTISPNAAGKALLSHLKKTVAVKLALTFTPINGKPRTHTFSGLPVGP